MQQLHWVKQGMQFYLKKGNETLVELTLNLKGLSSFTLNSKQYVASRKGAWNPGYFIAEKGQAVLSLKYGFWGSKGNIAFSDGAMYTCNYKSKGGLKMRFFNGEEELMAYGLGFENKRPVLNFSIGATTQITEKILLLAALGLIAFYPLFMSTAGGDDATFAAMLATTVATT